MPQIAELAGAYPYFFQELGSAGWPFADGNNITIADIDQVIPRYESKLDESFLESVLIGQLSFDVHTREQWRSWECVHKKLPILPIFLPGWLVARKSISHTKLTENRVNLIGDFAPRYLSKDIAEVMSAVSTKRTANDDG